MKKVIRLVFSLVAAVLLYGCSSTQQTVDESAGEVRYSLVYIIHADANYTYHVNGEYRKADLDVLNKAIEMGRNAKHGEVFIFHQKPESKLLFLFPKKDRTFYHFRNGELVGGKLYSPAGGGLAAEVRLFNENRPAATKRNIFLYFGHEIPAGQPRLVYHQSQPINPFNTQIFAYNFENFDTYFDLTILSTCNNGNPLMVDALTGLTDYIVASPQNLHLSHLADRPLKQLETNPDISTAKLAHDIAEKSFDRLSSFLQTEVTVAVYHLHQIREYIHSLAENYRNRLQNISQTSLFVNNSDCASLPEFENPLPGEGITLFYKPADFGRNSTADQHSGWGCKR